MVSAWARQTQVPLQSWSPTFNFSIWHVALIGDERPGFVQTCAQSFQKFRETEAMRLCLKFLRDRNYTSITDQLQSLTGVTLESPIVSELFQALVSQGDYRKAERIIFENMDLLHEYCQKQQYTPIWSPVECKGKEESPGPRGGHQLISDPSTGTLYLFGGWNGSKDLSDLWVYSIRNQSWTCLSEDTEAEGGPSPRSCHQMVLDPGSQQLFVLGKYVEMSERNSETLKSDFFSFHIPSQTWTRLAVHTLDYGGPRLLFDHHMSLDPVKARIYCFGGRVLDPRYASRRKNMLAIRCCILIRSMASLYGEFSFNKFFPKNSSNWY